MSNGILGDEVLPSAMAIARVAISEIVERTVKSMEHEYEREFKQRFNREPDDKEKLLLRKNVLKICRDYFSNSIETMEYYQKI